LYLRDWVLGHHHRLTSFPIIAVVDYYQGRNSNDAIICSPEANLSKIKLRIIGEKENGITAKPIKPITNFNRRNDSELMDPIVLQLDEETRFVKLNLYYGDDLLEDFYVRIPKHVVRSIFETVGVGKGAAVAREKIRQDKQEIKAKYEEARNEDNDTDTKGKALEEAIRKILELVPDLEIIGSRVVNDIYRK
jgi:hypothetical protein